MDEAIRRWERTLYTNPSGEDLQHWTRDRIRSSQGLALAALGHSLSPEPGYVSVIFQHLSLFKLGWCLALRSASELFPRFHALQQHLPWSDLYLIDLENPKQVIPLYNGQFFLLPPGEIRVHRLTSSDDWDHCHSCSQSQVTDERKPCTLCHGTQKFFNKIL